MKPLHWIVLVLSIIGALNWGLVGLFQFDLVAAIFGGPNSVPTRIVYTLVGLAGLVLIATETTLYGERSGPAMTPSPRP